PQTRGSNEAVLTGASGEPGGRGVLAQAPVMAQESAIAAAESAMAQVSAHVAARAREPARQRPIEIPPDAVINGELLRQIRQSRGLTLQQVADRTRISTRHLENVEADRYEALPATVYLRGFLMSLARELGIDPLRVSKGYLALVEKHAGSKGR
ncbi:MAG: helix-turn-helix domain-containing protein, partial [Myxococcaceae bacterium]|nr:helix-turn-helix domain-containing protein [Myxococcaceae bacterium]